MIDPKVRQGNAMHGAELANTTGDSGAQSTLFDMAAKWLEVAADLERAGRMLSVATSTVAIRSPSRRIRDLEKADSVTTDLVRNSIAALARICICPGWL